MYETTVVLGKAFILSVVISLFITIIFFLFDDKGKKSMNCSTDTSKAIILYTDDNNHVIEQCVPKEKVLEIN